MAFSQKKDARDAAPRELGRYRLHGEIASGGMATVYFGRLVGTAGFAKTVAIKCLHPQFAKIPEFLAMFLTEARVAARIRHPNVAQTLDVLEIDDETFLVMEYIDGESLSRLVRATASRHARVPFEVAISILCGVLHGLHAAHEAKNDRGQPLTIIHRDVSPQNVLVGVDGTARVIDFGIAKAADSVQITREGELKGKLSYMAPEQLSGGKVTRKVDIYAASVILWELLAGQRLFDADYQSAILKNILHRPVDAPSEVNRAVPREMDDIVLCGLSRDPNERFATARDMALAIEERFALANPSQVGAWVEHTAAESLARRAERIAQIESVPSGPLPDEREEVRSDMIVASARREDPTTHPRQSRRSREDSPPAERPPPSRHDRATDRPASADRKPPPSVVPPPSMPSPAPPTLASPASARASLSPNATLPPTSGPRSVRTSASPTPSHAGGVGSIGPLLPPPTITVAETSPVVPEWPVPGIAPAPPGVDPLPEAKRRSQGGGTAIVLVVVALAVVGFYFLLPELMRRGYVSSAAKDGLVLSIDQVEVHLQSIQLHGVSLQAVDVPGLTARAGLVEIELKKLDPVLMTVKDATVTADGSYAQLHDALSRWSSAHATKDDIHDTLERIVLESGKASWTRPFGESTRLEAENMTGQIERLPGHALGEDLEIIAPLASLTTEASGKLGPWRVRWRRQPTASQVTVLFDPSSGAQATLLVGDGAVSSVEAAIPRLGAAQLGVPPGAFGRRADDPLTIEGTLKGATAAPNKTTGELHLILSAARFVGAGAPVDAEIYGRVDGDSGQPLQIKDGLLTLGSIRGQLAGTILIAPGYVKGEFAWRPPVRCPLVDQALVANIRFDTRALDDATLGVSPAAHCGLKILPP